MDILRKTQWTFIIPIGFGLLLGEMSLKGSISLWVTIGIVVGVLGIIAVTRNIEALTIGIFMALLLGEILGNRSFSHLIIVKAPLYVTEFGMLVLSVLLVAQRKLFLPKFIRIPFISIMAVCIISAATNVFRFPYLSVLRDSAELYYLYFIPLAYSVYKIARPHISSRNGEVTIATLAWLTPIFYLITGALQLPAASEAVSASFIVFALSWNWKYVNPLVVWLSVPLNVVAMVYPGARGPWVGFVFGVIVLSVLSGKLHDPVLKSRIRFRVGLMLIVAIVSLSVVSLLTPSVYQHISKEIASLTTLHGSYSQVANNRWRIIIWGDAFRQFMGNPLAIRVGQNWMPEQLVLLGYGGLTVSGFGLNTVALSNSYLQMLQWYGLWAFIPFWVLIVRVCAELQTNIREIPIALSGIAILAIWAINTGVEVVLEGPYMSAVIWSLVGVLIGHIEYRRQNRDKLYDPT